MRILLTRPESDAQDLKIRLEVLGHVGILAPLLQIEYVNIVESAFAGAGALVATSRHGLTALVDAGVLASALPLPVFTVGEATALRARELGFQRVIAGAGTAADLVPLILADPIAHTRQLVHLAGDHLAFDLQAALAHDHVIVVTVPAYRSIAATALPKPVVEQLAGKEIDAVVLMSPRTAQTWINVASELPEPSATSNLLHVCVSDAVAAALADAWAKSRPHDASSELKIHVASRPAREEILALIGRLAAQ